MQFLMTDPNPHDPLNKEAAEAMLQDRAAFEKTVRRLVVSGGQVAGESFKPHKGITLQI